MGASFGEHRNALVAGGKRQIVTKGAVEEMLEICSYTEEGGAVRELTPERIATAKAICGHSGLSKTKISRAVKALEDRRWLERHRDRADRRFELLTLTQAGMDGYRRLKLRAGDYQRWLEGSLDLPYLTAIDDGLSGVETMIASGQLQSLLRPVEEPAA